MAAPGRRTRTQGVLARLRADILTGDFRDADMLPGERDLAERLTVSRTTLRRLLADLVAEGVLRHRQGIGTFIARNPGTPAAGQREPPPPPEPGRLAGFAEEMRAHGVIVTTREIERAIVLPTPDEAMMLACSPGERVLRLIRLRSTGSWALAIEHAAVPCRYIAGTDAIGASLYAALAESGSPPVRALQRVQATAIGEEDAVLLGMAVGTAGVSVRRTAYLASGRCCEFTRSVYPASRYDLMTETSAIG